MKIALYSRETSDQEFISYIIHFLENKGCELLLFSTLQKYVSSPVGFSNREELAQYKPIDFLFSLGGDGSFLEAASLVGNLNIPIMGINMGRIGFLTGISKSEFEKAYLLLANGKYDMEERALLHVSSPDVESLVTDFALNDVTLHSVGTAALSSFAVEIDGKKLNTYWADGLIVATPTGSTAYSLSCGGPIIAPQTKVNVITPIASHSLSVRPIVVSNEQELCISIRGRGASFLMTIDFHRVELPNPATIIISKERFNIQTIRFEEKDFYTIIRDKLMWGIDKRNLG